MKTVAGTKAEKHVRLMAARPGEVQGKRKCLYQPPAREPLKSLYHRTFVRLCEWFGHHPG